MNRIVVVDDDLALLKILKIGLESIGYTVVTARRGKEAVELCVVGRPDVLVVDLGLPDISGIEVLRRVRAAVPLRILVLSAFGDEAIKIQALDAGADDYVTKPFGMGELAARLRALGRRVEPDRPVELSSNGLTIDPVRCEVRAEDGTLVQLTKREFEVLEYLVRNSGRLCTYQMILQAVWGEGYGSETHYVRVYVNRLRLKLGDAAIVNRPGIGYLWSPGGSRQPQ